jgi:GNAT superfamily N-acetyltransferase
MASTITLANGRRRGSVALSCADRIGEFGMSIADDWRHLGAGSAMLQEIERKAAADGIELLFGDRSPTNAGMIGLARPWHPPRTGARTTPRANSEALGRRCPDLPCQKWSEIARGAELGMA